MIRPDLAAGIEQQAQHCEHNDAPGTGAVCRALIALAEAQSTACGRRIADWPGNPIDGAMPLRLAGGLHDLYRRGQAPELGVVYGGEMLDRDAVDAIVGRIVAAHDDALLPWLDGPPQTNEAGRSASFVAALHWLASRVVPRFDCLEIGSSAGLNLLIDRWRYDLGGVVSGPVECPVTIRPDWRGAPPPADAFQIVSVAGSDIAPIDVRDAAAADRLRAYVWPEMPERFARLDAGIAMIAAHPVDLVAADAADWVEERLARPQTGGTTRALMHSIVWQYLPDETRARIETAMAAAGADATTDCPLAWISLETDRTTMRHELSVRFWPGGEVAVRLGSAHAHGAWVAWEG